MANLPEEVEAIYEEARDSVSVRAFTGAVMLCRKILMHIAVENGASEGKSFKTYVNWLLDEHYAPRGAEPWIDYIRERGNFANHEIALMERKDAVGVLTFTEALLRNVYELPNAVPFFQSGDGDV